MEQDQRESRAKGVPYVTINSVASLVSAEIPADPGGGNRLSGLSASTGISAYSAKTNTTAGQRSTAGQAVGNQRTIRTTMGQQPSLTKTEKWLMNRNKLKLFFAMGLGALAWFISSYDGLNEYLYGANWEREWLWWFVTVPFYVFVVIYFARFVGSYLMRIWIWEIVNSPWVHGAVVTLLTGILSEETADELFAAALSKPAIVEAASKLTSDVITSHPVQDSCVNTVVGTLLSTKVTDAVVTSAERLLREPGMHRAMAGLIGNEVFVQPIATQAARIVQSDEVVSATIGVMQDVLENQDVRAVIKRRAESVAGDAELFTAGRRGLYEAVMGPPSAVRTAPDGESTGSTSCDDGVARPTSCLPYAGALDSSCGPLRTRYCHLGTAI